MQISWPVQINATFVDVALFYSMFQSFIIEISLLYVIIYFITLFYHYWYKKKNINKKKSTIA